MIRSTYLSLILFGILLSTIKGCQEGKELIDNIQPTGEEAEGADPEPSYCANLITWSISDDSYFNHRAYDTRAKNRYTELYQKWLAFGGENSDPTNDCLGIARQVFCSYEYAYCDIDSNSTRVGLCQFLCDLWVDRCPQEKDTYNQICQDSRDSDCAYSYSLFSNIVLILFCIMLIL